MPDKALAASLRLKANTGLVARVIRVARVNAFIGRDLVARDGLEIEVFDRSIEGLFRASIGMYIKCPAAQVLALLPVSLCWTEPQNQSISGS